MKTHKKSIKKYLRSLVFSAQILKYPCFSNIDMSLEKFVSKTAFIRKSEAAGFNNSFYTPANVKWFHYIINYQPSPAAPAVFLPCASGAKTRSQSDGRKFISQSLSHQYMSAVTRNPAFDKIILSEPCTIIPYALEDSALRPDYNLPPEDLSIQCEQTFIHQVAMYLMRFKLAQPERSQVYYLGGAHHYFILHFANKLAGAPFKIIYNVPERGLVDYAKAAKEFVTTIKKAEKGEPIDLRPLSLEAHVKKRGRYTNLKFWRAILMSQKGEQSKVNVCSPAEFRNGFAYLYEF